MKILVTQWCPTLCDPTDYTPWGSSVHGVLQARVLEWVAMPSSRGFFQPRDQTQTDSLPVEPPGKPMYRFFCQHKTKQQPSFSKCLNSFLFQKWNVYEHQLLYWPWCSHHKTRKSLNLYPMCVWTFLSPLCDAPWEVIKTLDIKNAQPLQIPHQNLTAIYIILHK